MELKHSELTEKIIKGFYETYNELGAGFLESVYENSLKNGFRKLRSICKNSNSNKCSFQKANRRQIQSRYDYK